MEFKKFIKHPVFWMMLLIALAMAAALIYKPDFTVWNQSEITNYVKIFIGCVFIGVVGIVIYRFKK